MHSLMPNFAVDFIKSLYLGRLKAVPFPSWCYETAKGPESWTAAAQCVILMCLQTTRRETVFSRVLFGVEVI